MTKPRSPANPRRYSGPNDPRYIYDTQSEDRIMDIWLSKMRERAAAAAQPSEGQTKSEIGDTTAAAPQPDTP